MQGEAVPSNDVGERGLRGDRAFALHDVETGKIASAKSPRMWPNLLEFHAAFVDPPVPDGPLPPVVITLPDGRDVRTDDPDTEEVLSKALGRNVRLVTANPEGATYEYYVPDVEGVDPRGTDFFSDVPNDIFGTGSLHDAASVHILTTATLQRLEELYPSGRFDWRRFRPNVVVSCGDTEGFVENDWLKRTVQVGGASVRITAPTMRCVMTTVEQGDLPKDSGILRTAAQHNRLDFLGLGKFPCVGVYGLVEKGGPISTGDPVTVDE